MAQAGAHKLIITGYLYIILLSSPCSHIFDINNAQHKASIKKALAAGKPVPAEVLADYPDLKPKAEAKPKTVAAILKKKAGGQTTDQALEEFPW